MPKPFNMMLYIIPVVICSLILMFINMWAAVVVFFGLLILVPAVHNIINYFKNKKNKIN